MPRSDSPYFAFGSILAFIATAMFVAAVASPDWYEMHSGENHFRVGYFRVCNTSNGPVPKEECGNLLDTSMPYVAGVCEHSSTDMKLRQGFGAALGLLGAVLMLIIVALLLLAWWLQKTGFILYTTLILAIISVVGFIISTVIISNTFESWFYCNRDFCSYHYEYLYQTGIVNNNDCVTFHGYSFVYAVIAILAAVMCFCTILALLVQECFEARDKKEASRRRHRRNRNSHRDEDEDGSYDDEEEDQMLAIEEDKKKSRQVAVVSGHSPFHDNRRHHNRSEEEDPYHLNRTTDDVRRERSTPSRANRASPHRGSPHRNPIEEIARSPSTPARRHYDDDEPSGLNNMSDIRGGGSVMPVPQPADEDADGSKLGYWPSDWVFHPQSKLYWSTSQQLYLDPASEHYYDPHSGKWYDPKRDVWYEKDE